MKPAYGILKRPDEKYVTEKDCKNSKVACIVAYEIESEHVESIHNHSAIAVIICDKRI